MTKEEFIGLMDIRQCAEGRWYVHGDIAGDVCGNVEGNVEGDVRGDVKGNVEGKVWGDNIGGAIQAGATMELIERPTPNWTLARLITAFYSTPLEPAFLEAAARLPALQGEWRAVIESRLSTGVVEDWNERMYGDL